MYVGLDYLCQFLVNYVTNLPIYPVFKKGMSPPDLKHAHANYKAVEPLRKGATAIDNRLELPFN